MGKLRIGIIDVVTHAPNTSPYGRVMLANLASIMPQVVAVWCEELGHEVTLSHYHGYKSMTDELPDDLDVVFFGAFTSAAQLVYALSNMFRSKGAVTVLGGPHARAYPEDARKYFDYVLGFTDRTIIQDVLQDASQHRPLGAYLSARQQPTELPGVRERWPFIERLLRKAPLVKIVPMLGSLGCPYSCSFCVDSQVAYHPLDFEGMKEDLRFLRTKMKRPAVGWHDPNFGVRFNDYMETIEEAIPPNSIDFLAESSLSLLSEANVERLKRNGFKAMLPGIESWFELGNKSKTGRKQGLEKVHRVAEHINMILSHLPYLQANLVLGLDSDEGDEPFELTKRFLDLAPGAFPGYSMLTSFGGSAPLNIEYERQGRVIPFPFHFVNTYGAMNVRPKNYSWPEFYDRTIDLFKYSFSRAAISRRLSANRGWIPKTMNVIRAVSGQGWGKIRYHQEIRRRLDQDRPLRQFFDQETTAVPRFLVDRIRSDLGPMWEWLPKGALSYDPNPSLAASIQFDGEAAD